MARVRDDELLEVDDVRERFMTDSRAHLAVER
jgi:hypothetical protein